MLLVWKNQISCKNVLELLLSCLSHHSCMIKAKLLSRTAWVSAHQISHLVFLFPILDWVSVAPDTTIHSPSWNLLSYFSLLSSFWLFLFYILFKPTPFQTAFSNNSIIFLGAQDKNIWVIFWLFFSYSHLIYSSSHFFFPLPLSSEEISPFNYLQCEQMRKNLCS